MERKLSTIRTIDKVSPIEGADKIEAYHIGGWIVVDQKGAYKQGDKVLYHEIDSMIPLSNPNYKFLEKRGISKVNGKEYHRLKTAKLRGVFSQGLIMPLSVLGDSEIKEDFDYSKQLGIFKYEAPIPFQMKGKASSWPAWIDKTDEERIQNISNIVQYLKSDEWIPYQKIDGTSTTVYAQPDGKIGICSRNYELLEEDNSYWNVVKSKKIKVGSNEMSLLEVLINKASALNKTVILQGELFGESIQKNPIGIKEQDIKFFTIQLYDENSKTNVRLSPSQINDDNLFKLIYEQLWVPILDVNLPSSLEEIIKQPDGLHNKVVGGNNSQIEGIVWRHKDVSMIKIPREKKIDVSKIPEEKREEVLSKIGNPNYIEMKASFKVISNKYLLKNE